MGYDIHITRRKSWADTGDDITTEEWLAYVQRDPELRPLPKNGKYFFQWGDDSWLDWSKGVIYSKNPNEPLLTKMTAIAKQFNATVQGDDGEIYDGSGSPRQPKTSLGFRIAGWFSKPPPKPQQKVEHEPLPFGVGDTVVDAWGFEHTIISIEPDANHGLGRIQSRRNKDGTEHSCAVIAHGFNPVPKK
jgi:hypothetical protein